MGEGVLRTHFLGALVVGRFGLFFMSGLWGLA